MIFYYKIIAGARLLWSWIIDLSSLESSNEVNSSFLVITKSACLISKVKCVRLLKVLEAARRK